LRNIGHRKEVLREDAAAWLLLVSKIEERRKERLLFISGNNRRRRCPIVLANLPKRAILDGAQDAPHDGAGDHACPCRPFPG
jgi:hypothetical protein